MQQGTTCRALAVPPSFCLVMLCAGLGLLAGGCSRVSPAPAAKSTTAETPAVASRDDSAIFESPFENTRPGVAYTGSTVCKECHAGHAESYHTTGMGRSMSRVDPDQAPPDATFDHAASHRRYQVLRRDGKLWHRELALTNGPEAVVLAELPVTWAVGSGRHAMTYVAEAEGFLVESPITWYASTKSWGMSPGYDQAEHLGFQRDISEGCLSCHAGRAVAVDRTLNRMQVFEATIGCERCHGPGELHVARQRERPTEKAGKTIDSSIVNPAHLSRELAESICQQCHLRSQGTVVARGRKQSDFRPGLPLQAFRQDFVLESPDSAQTVVGHVEQLHLSRCYQQSPELSCATCHAPHAEQGAAAMSVSRNQHCAKCHEAGDCRVSPAERERVSPLNDCVQCHMPQSDTDIPHVAFTHHRIGIHRAEPPSPAKSPGASRQVADLRSFHESVEEDATERQRSLGLAYLEAGAHQESPEAALAFRQRAWRTLKPMHDAGTADSAVEAALARLAVELQSGSPEPFARAAFRDPALAGKDRCNVLFLLAGAELQRGNVQAALPLAEELTQLRRHPMDWLMLGECRRQMGGDGIAALETALTIKPDLAEVRRFLVRHYTEHNQPREAVRHQQRLER